MKSCKLIPGLVAMTAVFALACGSDSNGGGTDVVADPGKPNDPGPTIDQGKTDTPMQMVTFKAVVKDNLTKAVIEGAEVTAIDNDTGDMLTYQTLSDGQGNIAMEVPADHELLGFRVTADLFKDTYQFNIDSDAQDEEIWAVSVNGFEMAAGLAGFVPDKTKSVVAGAIYWVNEAGEEEYVSCGHVVADPAGEYRYFDEFTGLPAPLADVPHTMAGKGEGRFVVGNVPPGLVTLTTYFGDDPASTDDFIGTAKFFAYPDSIAITNVYADKDKYPAENPSPATCE
ncbi:MAG: hypothetical protein ISR64_08985 [Deltaproteobacteria bacterium]|nr:hypothetical protein [Deltaproteobacteria bacterium]